MEIDQLERKLRHLKKEYKRKKDTFQQVSVRTMEKGPHSFEAEQGYPEALKRYKKAGKELHDTRKELKVAKDKQFHDKWY